jgi:hypothetical protein
MSFIGIATLVFYILVIIYFVLGFICIFKSNSINAIYAIISLAIWPVFASQDENNKDNLCAYGFIILLLLPIFTPIFFLK